MASLLQHMGFYLVVSRFSCPTASGILVLQPGVEPVSAALEDRFLTTGPQGSPLVDLLLVLFLLSLVLSLSGFDIRNCYSSYVETVGKLSTVLLKEFI